MTKISELHRRWSKDRDYKDQVRDKDRDKDRDKVDQREAVSSAVRRTERTSRPFRGSILRFRRRLAGRMISSSFYSARAM